MNRLEAVAGGTLLALFAAGIAQKVRQLDRLAGTPAPDKEAPRELRPVRTVDGMIGAYVANAEAAGEAERPAQLGSLMASLESPELDGEELSPETGERLAKLISDVLGRQETPDEEVWGRAAGYLAARVGGKTSREFVLKTIETAPEPVRRAALSKLGSPGGPRGGAIWAKVQELASAGRVPPDLLPGLLRRTGGAKAKDVLLKVMSESSDPRLVSGCVVSLQDYRDPELLGAALERAEKLGLLEGNGRLPWISPALLDAYLKTADRPAFRRGMLAMAARPALVKTGEAHVERGLQSEDAETRRAAAAAVKKAVLARLLDAKRGEELLAGRLRVETEPVLKAELTGGLERVRSVLEAAPSGVQ